MKPIYATTIATVLVCLLLRVAGFAQQSYALNAPVFMIYPPIRILIHGINYYPELTGIGRVNS